MSGFMEKLFLDKKTEKIAKQIIEENSLCDNCLGRLFHKKDDAFSNKKRQN